MVNNTYTSDINEILLGYYLAGKKWQDDDTKCVFEDRKSKITREQYLIQKKRAKSMAVEILSWIENNKFPGKITRVWWASRANSLTKIIGKKIDSSKNPTDVLIKFFDESFLGTMLISFTNTMYLGISTKSTASMRDVPFKTLGLGFLEKKLGNVRLKEISNRCHNVVIDKFNLPKIAKHRKTIIRNDSRLADEVNKIGVEILSEVRDEMFRRLSELEQNFLLNHILIDWLNSSKALNPPYIKVTGMGAEDVSVRIENPLLNDKISAIMENEILITKVGNCSIGISAGGKNVLRIRAKYASQMTASSIKFSGDPY